MLKPLTRLAKHAIATATLTLVAVQAHATALIDASVMAEIRLVDVLGAPTSSLGFDLFIDAGTGVDSISVLNGTGAVSDSTVMGETDGGFGSAPASLFLPAFPQMPLFIPGDGTAQEVSFSAGVPGPDGDVFVDNVAESYFAIESFLPFAIDILFAVDVALSASASVTDPVNEFAEAFAFFELGVLDPADPSGFALLPGAISELIDVTDGSAGGGFSTLFAVHVEAFGFTEVVGFTQVSGFAESLTPASVPEPATFAFLTLALAGLRLGRQA